MHPAPRHTGRRSSSSNPAARHTRGLAGRTLARPQERAGQRRLRPDAGEAGNGGEHQSRGAKNGKDRSPGHGTVPGKGFACAGQFYRLGRVGALTAVNNFPAVRFSQASAVTDLMPVASHQAAGGLHAVLRQSRDGRA
jgi:hypothetical protein